MHPSITSLRRLTTVSQRRLLDAVHSVATAHGRSAWLVGGAVRDLALARRPADLDVALDGAAALFARRVAIELAPARVEVKTERRFGTASVTLYRGDAAPRLDLAQLRGERYPRPGALPVVRLGAPLTVDLARRDVTVNAIALGLTGRDRGRLLDPFGGLADLRAGRLRALHEGSFRDDATRLWRNARTAATAGLVPDEETLRWSSEGVRYLETISGDRLWAEFELVAGQARVDRVVALLDGWGVLRGTHERWRLAEASRRAIHRRRHAPGAAVLAAVLLAPLRGSTAILDRLNAPTNARAAVEGARLLLHAPAGRSAALERLTGTNAAARTAAVWLAGDEQRVLQRELRRWERTRSHLDATGLQRLGVPVGPAIGAWLRRLRRARFDGRLDSAAAARRLVRRELEESS